MKILFLTNTTYVSALKDSEIPKLSSLRCNVSTDEIIPARYCLFYKDIGIYALIGDRFNQITEGFITQEQIECIAAGANFGCGSAREHAAITFKEAGIKLIIAASFNKTFRTNCTNLGLYTCANQDIIQDAIHDTISWENILSEFTGFEKQILQYNGLFEYSKHHTTPSGDTKHPHDTRPMTIAEKIISRHLTDSEKSAVFVKPGDEIIAPVDIRFSYEVFTPLIAEILSRNTIALSHIQDPGSILLFEDHFILSTHQQVPVLVQKQQDFARTIKAHVYKHTQSDSGICHTVLIERHVLPGYLVVGTDSHTGTAGVCNALCLPVGATAMANAFVTKTILLTVPRTIRLEFTGKKSSLTTAKDVMLSFFTHEIVKNHNTLGTVLEFAGEGLSNFSVDELSVLPNMAAECGAWTGILEPHHMVQSYLSSHRSVPERQLEQMYVYPDANAQYAQRITIDLTRVLPMISLPSDPTNAVPLSSLQEKVRIDKAFIGSCTGGKLEDIMLASEILKGNKVAPHVQLVVQAASMYVYEQAKLLGLERIIHDAGGSFLPAACGACIGQGPGSVEKGEIVISSTNRNYRGRMGQGDAYLANPMVVAKSAIQGHI